MINTVEKRVDASLEKMWKLKFGHVFVSLIFVQTFVNILKLKLWLNQYC